MSWDTGAWEFGRRHALLERVTLAYVSLPFFVFAIGWLRPLLAIPVVGVVLAGVYLASRPDAEPSVGTPPPGGMGWLVLGTLFLLTVLLVVYSGAGGWAHQYHDYLRHNAFLRDLIEKPWPLFYEATGPRDRPGLLAFYIANSLPPAVVGKAFGWAAANAASVLWMILGLFLGVCWFLRIVGRISLGYGLLFLFFGGLDLVGQVVTQGWFTDGSAMLSNWMVRYAGQNPETMNGVFWYYPSNLNLVYYAPQHVVGPWLCLLVPLYDATHAGTSRRAVLLWSFALLWSAFASVGSLPFIALAILMTGGRGLRSFGNTAAAAAVLLTTGLYLTSNNGDYPHGFLWEFQDVLQTWPTLLLFYAVEFGLFAWLCPRIDRAGGHAISSAWFWVAIACLLALPWYKLGRYNDFTTKVCLPSLLVLQVILASGIANASTALQRRRRGWLVACLVLGSFASVADLARGVRGGLDFAPPRLDHVAHANELRPKSLSAQLFSDGNGFFWSVLARDVSSARGTPP